MHRKSLIFLLVLTATVLRGMPEWVRVAEDGSFRMENTVFRIVHFGTGHAVSFPSSGEWKERNPSALFKGKLAGGTFSAELIASANDSLRYRAEFSSSSPVETLGLMMVFRISDAERVLMVNGKKFTLSFPSDRSGKTGDPIPKRKCEQLVIPLDSGSHLTISGKMELKVMDFRDGRPDPIEVRL